MKRRFDNKKYSQTKRILGEFGLREITMYLVSNYGIKVILKSLVKSEKNELLIIREVETNE